MQLDRLTQRMQEALVAAQGRAQSNGNPEDHLALALIEQEGGGREVSSAWLPHFSWHDGTAHVPVRWGAFERTAETAMARRD